MSRRGLLGGMGASAAALALRPSAALAARDRTAPRVIDLPVAGGRLCRVTHWAARRRRGTMLFSHGALSAPWKYDPLILPWVDAGYDVWAPLHVDSTDHPDTRAYTGFMSWRARIEDVRSLARHIPDRRFIAAGHSYGALVALTLGGAAADMPEGLSGPLAEPRVRAVIALSPPAPVKGLVSLEGYASLAVPALIQTGDRDVPPGAPAAPDAWRGHLSPYEAAAPGGDRYALVLDGVDHFFGGAICWLDQPGPPQTAQLAITAGIARLFADAHGLGLTRARRSLDARLSETGPVRLSRK